MTTMFFGQYLLVKGVIDREALLEALDRQRTIEPQPARTRGSAGAHRAKPSGSDHGAVPALGSPHRSRFSSTAAVSIRNRLNVCSTNSGRAGCGSVRRSPKAGHLTEEAIAANLAEYRSLESAADQKIREAMQHLPNAEAVSACVELTVFHYSRVTGLPAKLESVSVETDVLEEGLQRFSQRIFGDGDYTIAVDLPPTLIAAVGRGMLGFEVEPGSETEADAVCEVINLIGGNACTRIEQFGNLLRPEPPVWSGSGEPGLPV